MAETDRKSRGILYRPHTKSYFLVFAAVLSFTLFLFFLGIVGTAFRTLFPGLGPFGTLTILSSCLVGSYINIPLTKIRSERPIVKLGHMKVFGIIYHVPVLAFSIDETLLTINVGGAIVPLITSIYLISTAPQALVNIILAVVLVAVIVNIVSKPIMGVGIVSPTLVPPLSAALSAVLLGGTAYTHIIAYVSGTLGTLIGADLLNFKVFSKLGSPIISIGGAGTFDGVFLSGIVAVLIAV